MSPERRSSEGQPQAYTLERVVKLAKEVVLEHGNHVPTLIVEGSRNGAIVQLRDFPETHEAKMLQMAEAGFKLARRRTLGELQQVFFVTEAWMSFLKKDQAPVNPPSQDPQRLEALVVSSLDARTNKTELVAFEMLRDMTGRLYDLVSVDMPREDTPNESGGPVQVESPLLEAFHAGYLLGSGGGPQRPRRSS